MKNYEGEKHIRIREPVITQNVPNFVGCFYDRPRIFLIIFAHGDTL